MAENWWDSYKRTDEEENWWESYKRADEPAPSAGGGRGFVNPPRVFEKQPVRSAPPAPVEPTDYGQASTDMMGGSVPARSVMDQPGLAPRTPGYDPMLNQEYVAKVRQDIIGKAAPEDRMGLLTTLSEKRTDVLGRAARQILAEVQVENKRINFDQERRAERALNDLREAGNPSPPRQSGNAPAPLSFSAPPPVPVPDVFPGIGDVMDGRTPQQIAERRMLAQGIRVADDGMRMDEANRVTNLARDRTAGEYLGDLGVRIEQGGIMARQVIANTIDPTSQWASDLAEKMKASQKAISAPEQYRAQQFALTLAEQPNEWAKGAVMLAEFLTNPTIAVEEVVRQGPLMGAMIAATVVGGGAGGLAVRGAAAVSPRVAFADAISGGMVARAGAAAGAAGVARGAAAVAAGGDAAGQVYEELTSKKNERLMQENADVKRLMDEGKTFEDARSEVALTKARLAQSIAATGGVIFGAAGFEGLLAKKIAGQAIGSTAKRAVVVDLATELADELTTLGASNFAIGQVDPSRALTQDFGQTAATTLVTAAPTAGASAYLARQDQSADPFTDYAARASPSTQNPDGTLIAPEQSARRPYDIGPSAPIRSGADGEINFTPQGSITAEAGLAPIVVPMGAGQQTGGVNGGLPDVLGGLAGGSGVAGGGDPLAGLGSPGRDAGLPGRGGANAQGALVGDGGLALPGAGAGQPGPSLAAGRGERATDADLLARAGQASEGAPAKIWAGRAGDGYAQQQDAQQAFPSLQRRYPDLSWSMQQDADGKFYWSGRSTGESNGSVAGAAGQGLAGVPGVGSAGQEADAGAGVVGFGPSRIGQPGQPGGASTVGSASPDGPAFTLNLAPPAPRQTVLRAITSVKSAQGVDIEFEAQSLTDQQKVASAMARLVGKTVTFYTHKAGPAAAVPNGFVLDGNDRDIFLDKSSNDGALFVMMHEGVHALPQPIREKLVETLKGLTKTDMRADFATKFSYDINNEYQIDNEIAAFMTQAVSKRKDFWQELRTKMGDGDFVEVAKVIISKLDTFIRGASQAYGEDFLKRYATDAVGVRDAVSTAYAQAMKAQGQQAPAGAASALTFPAADQVTPSQRLQQPVVFDFSQTLFKPQTDAERRQNFANRFNNPVTLADGTRLSGFTDPARQTTFHGYDKNGEQLTIRAEFVSPEDIVFSKDSNRTAELVRNGLMKLQETAPASKNITPSNRAADVNPLGMYSELARKIDAGPGQAMPDQWRGYIRGLTTKGVKPDEIEWSGVEDFISLKGGKVSKQEVADYLKQGGVKVEETVLGGARGLPKFLNDYFENTTVRQPTTTEGWIEEAARQERKAQSFQAQGLPDTAKRFFELSEAMNEYAEGGETGALATKYSEYTLPGGENYREVLLKLPTKKIKPFVDPHSEFTRRMLERYGRSWDRSMTSDERSEEQRLARESDSLFTKAAEESQRGSYQSSHWSQSNVLAHIRVNDRTDADGKKVLFVEEIQSDWGQEGKRKGFKLTDAEIEEKRNRLFDAGDFRGASTVSIGESGKLPTAPFVTKTEGWLNLALKRVMTMAAEGGYDRVAFVNGEQSADRYDLSKKISKIRYDQYSSGNGQLFAYDNGGYLAIDKPATPEDLADMIGKEVASRLMDQQPKDAVSSGGSRARRRELSGLDLKVGGEGMKAFYDTIVPTALKKLLPKVGGGQVEMVGVNIGDKEAIANWKRMAANSSIESAPIKEFETQPGFDITPAMREKVATTGLPMFSKKVTEGADGAATAGAQGIASASRSEVEKAEDYERENGILPYTSDGQIEVPVRIQLSVKLLGKYEQHPILDIPVNKNGTVTLYYPTTNEEARRVARDKTLKASPGSNRIYLTNESSAPKVMNQRGNIEQRLEGANVLVQVDPSLLQLDMEHSDGRKDFFIPLAEGKEFFNKMRMTRLFTQNAPRSKALTKDTRLTDLERRISDGIDKYVGLTKSEQRIRLKEAKSVLSREHNVTTLLGVNGKLEKTNTGGYGLNNYDGKDVKSMGLGLASAQKINEQNLSTCPKSAICEGLCLGETSGQNKLYGGDGQYRSGPRLSQYLKTEAMVVHPEEFAVVLHSEIAKLERNANKEDYQATVRLNVTSDFRPQTFKAIISAFPDVVFYDYTKLPTKSIASNHHLTYSSTGASQVVDGKTIFNPESNWNKMVAVMGRGDNVAMAFSDKTTMPKYVVDGKTGERFQVWNGDNYDARFLDPKPGATGNEFNKGMVIGLTNKDRTVKPELAAKKNQGFFIDYNPERDGDTITIKDQDALASDRKTIAIKLAPSEVEGKAGDAPIASNRVTEDRAAAPAQPKATTPATVIVGGRTLRIPDPAGAVETLDAKINRYSELLKCLQ